MAAKQTKRRKAIIADIFDYDADVMVLLHREGKEERRKYPRMDFDHLSDDECVEMFRFKKNDIIILGDQLRIPDPFICTDRSCVEKSEALCIFLRRMTYPNRLLDLERIFGRDRTVLSRIANEVLDWIYDHTRHLLEDLRQPWIHDNMEVFARSIHEKGAALDNCWGFIDGTTRPICRPTMYQRQCYNGHKRYHCLKYQSVVTPNGLIANMFGPMEGRRHDSGMLRKSNLIEDLEEVTLINGKRYSLFGDPAYPLNDRLIGPFKGAQITEEQREFNRSMSAVRIVVEWVFGKVCTIFAFTDFKKNQKLFLQSVGKMYLVAAILTNCHTCLYGSETSEFFGLEPPALQEYLRPRPENQ